MKAQRAITVVLLAFVGVSVAYLIVQSVSSRAPGPGEPGRTHGRSTAPEQAGEVAPPSTEPAGQPIPKLVAYYFHRTKRCRTCLAIEANGREALEEAFPEALKAGTLVWRAVNVEEPGNQHYIERYALTSGGLVLVNPQADGAQAWRNLEKVWELVGDALRFKAYVEAEAAVMMEEQP
jgi:hypothetical protein